MFFDNAKDARIAARIESIRTHFVHQVIPCKKYLCPPKEYFGRDYISGFTVILTKKRFTIS